MGRQHRGYRGSRNNSHNNNYNYNYRNNQNRNNNYYNKNNNDTSNNNNNINNNNNDNRGTREVVDPTCQGRLTSDDGVDAVLEWTQTIDFTAIDNYTNSAGSPEDAPHVSELLQRAYGLHRTSCPHCDDETPSTAPNCAVVPYCIGGLWELKPNTVEDTVRRIVSGQLVSIFPDSNPLPLALIPPGVSHGPRRIVRCSVDTARMYSSAMRQGSTPTTGLPPHLIAPLLPPGLRNLRSTCYANSVLQLLFHIAELRQGIIVAGESSPDLEKLGLPQLFAEMLYSEGGTHLTTTTNFRPTTLTDKHNDIEALASEDRPVVDPHGILVKQDVNPSVQQDAHEFLVLLLQRIEGIAKASTVSHPSMLPQRLLSFPELVKQTLSSGMIYERCCGECKEKFLRADTSTLWSLSIPRDCRVLGEEKRGSKTFTLEDSIMCHLTDSTIEGFKCSKCFKTSTAVVTTVWKTAPEALILHLQRYTSDQKKITSTLSAPRVMDLNAYLGVARQGRENTLYELDGIVNHHGATPTSGHYTFTGRLPYERIAHPSLGGTPPPSVPECETPPDVWFKADDTTVTLVPNPFDKDDRFNSNTAYMVLYRRVHSAAPDTQQSPNSSENKTKASPPTINFKAALSSQPSEQLTEKKPSPPPVDEVTETVDAESPFSHSQYQHWSTYVPLRYFESVVKKNTLWRRAYHIYRNIHQEYSKNLSEWVNLCTKVFAPCPVKSGEKYRVVPTDWLRNLAKLFLTPPSSSPLNTRNTRPKAVDFIDEPSIISASPSSNSNESLKSRLNSKAEPWAPAMYTSWDQGDEVLLKHLLQYHNSPTLIPTLEVFAPLASSEKCNYITPNVLQCTHGKLLPSCASLSSNTNDKVSIDNSHYRLVPDEAFRALDLYFQDAQRSARLMAPVITVPSEEGVFPVEQLCVECSAKLVRAVNESCGRRKKEYFLKQKTLQFLAGVKKIHEPHHEAQHSFSGQCVYISSNFVQWWLRQPYAFSGPDSAVQALTFGEPPGLQSTNTSRPYTGEHLTRPRGPGETIATYNLTTGLMCEHGSLLPTALPTVQILQDLFGPPASAGRTFPTARRFPCVAVPVPTDIIEYLVHERAGFGSDGTSGYICEPLFTKKCYDNDENNIEGVSQCQACVATDEFSKFLRGCLTGFKIELRTTVFNEIGPILHLVTSGNDVTWGSILLESLGSQLQQSQMNINLQFMQKDLEKCAREHTKKVNKAKEGVKKAEEAKKKRDEWFEEKKQIEELERQQQPDKKKISELKIRHPKDPPSHEDCSAPPVPPEEWAGDHYVLLPTLFFATWYNWLDVSDAEVNLQNPPVMPIVIPLRNVDNNNNNNDNNTWIGSLGEELRASLAHDWACNGVFDEAFSTVKKAVVEALRKNLENSWNWTALSGGNLSGLPFYCHCAVDTAVSVLLDPETDLHPRHLQKQKGLPLQVPSLNDSSTLLNPDVPTPAFTLVPLPLLQKIEEQLGPLFGPEPLQVRQSSTTQAETEHRGKGRGSGRRYRRGQASAPAQKKEPTGVFPLLVMQERAPRRVLVPPYTVFSNVRPTVLPESENNVVINTDASVVADGAVTCFDCRKKSLNARELSRRQYRSGTITVVMRILHYTTKKRAEYHELDVVLDSTGSDSTLNTIARRVADHLLEKESLMCEAEKMQFFRVSGPLYGHSSNYKNPAKVTELPRELQKGVKYTISGGSDSDEDNVESASPDSGDGDTYELTLEQLGICNKSKLYMLYDIKTTKIPSSPLPPTKVQKKSSVTEAFQTSKFYTSAPAMPAVPDNVKSCPACTFDNAPERAQCEMCETPL